MYAKQEERYPIKRNRQSGGAAAAQINRDPLQPSPKLMPEDDIRALYMEQSGQPYGHISSQVKNRKIDSTIGKTNMSVPGLLLHCCLLTNTGLRACIASLTVFERKT